MRYPLFLNIWILQGWEKISLPLKEIFPSAMKNCLVWARIAAYSIQFCFSCLIFPAQYIFSRPYWYCNDRVSSNSVKTITTKCDNFSFTNFEDLCCCLLSVEYSVFTSYSHENKVKGSSIPPAKKVLIVLFRQRQSHYKEARLSVLYHSVLDTFVIMEVEQGQWNGK